MRGLPPLLLALLLALLAAPAGARLLSQALGATAEPFPADRLIGLAVTHAGLSLAGVLPAALLGIGLGIAVTRGAGQGLRPAADALAAAAQAVPPVVVVALAVPAFGFGLWPTAFALLLYGLMPVLRATVAGLESVPPDARAAAIAIGLPPARVLAEVEWPLAWPVVLDGLRVALVLGIATAAVGALAGATTLGTPIVLGLQNQNQVLVVQGAAATAALAFAAEGLLLAVAGRRAAA
ncbi:ABC transporter permease [Falsiroseomonas bella]|uniref:ABC transporter permease n=1 Tax=Falsiroseomonas bella TaxID=2184016 RepID=UPI001E4C13D8|nr:ABC transporter permease subunit [Falsiroseomonas bella]